MNMGSTVCAPSTSNWQGIEWSQVKRQVKRLQARIVKATQEGRHCKVKALQWLLTHSFSGKALGLQARIVKATQEGRHCKVKALQWLLTHSFSGKALAVKRVTENRGKHTRELITKSG